MQKFMLALALGASALLLTACSVLSACGLCEPEPACEPVCEPVYASPCCPPPAQGLGYGGTPGAPASSCGGAGDVCGG
jgi:hypothetical protein